MQTKAYNINDSISISKNYNDAAMPTQTMAINQNNSQFLFHHQYNFDLKYGNLQSRSDLLNNQTETFGYDKQHRLTHINNIETVKYNQQNGSINYKLDVGDYTYDANKNNAVQTVSNNNSNVPLMQQDVKYNAFDRPSEIEEIVNDNNSI